MAQRSGSDRVRANGGKLAVKFDDDAASRRVMIGKLFAGGYSNEIERISMRSVLFRSVQTLFR